MDRRHRAGRAWSAPRTRPRVLVHPGFFFDFSHGAFLVISLLPGPAVFEGVKGPLADRFTLHFSMVDPKIKIAVCLT